MSISTNSINCGDDFTQAENGAVNGNALNLDNDGQFVGKNNESIADQQQLKEFRQKIARMEMELKMAKFELENKEQKLKYQELMGEQKALKEKVAKIGQEKEKNASADQLAKVLEKISELEKQHENTTKADVVQGFSQLQNEQKKFLDKISELEKQQKEQKKASADQLAKILEKISEMEKQQKQQQNENTKNVEQFLKMQNDQKILLEKISELEKEQKQRKASSNLRQNYWDANVCHEKLEIIGDKKLIVHYKQNDIDWCSVFAKYPILLNNNWSDTFYYEISVKNMKSLITFGFAVKQQNKFDGIILSHKGTYAYYNRGDIWINGKGKGRNGKYSYGVGDTVGIGVNSATRQIIFTKNGLRLDSADDFLVASSFADDSFYYPFVILFNSDDQIEANFGPNFKFDFSTL